MNHVSVFFKRLTRIHENEPVSLLVLLLILILDFFILNILMGGLEEHTRQLTSPDDYFPQEARSVFMDDEWTDSGRMDKLQQMIITDYRQYHYRYEGLLEAENIARMHGTASRFFQSIQTITDDDSLKTWLIQREALQKERAGLESEINLLQAAYEIRGKDTSELDKKIVLLADAMEETVGQIQHAENRLNRHSVIRGLWQQVGEKPLRADLIEALNTYERSYVFRKFFWRMLFLLPLLGLVLYWHVRSVRRHDSIQILISSHVVVLAALPAAMELIHLIYELIPYHLFRRFFDMIKRLHLIAIWHYLVLAAAILMTVVFIYWIQKKLFCQKRLTEKRLMGGCCVYCGKKVPESAVFCPFCGQSLTRQCGHCDQPTLTGGIFCINCGKKLSEGAL